jgi:hypothetical protein
MGYKEDAYRFYREVFTMNTGELNKLIETQPLSHDWVKGSDTNTFKRDSLQNNDWNKNLKIWKTIPILSAIELLSEYNDSKTKDLIRKAVIENPYISSIIFEYKNREIVNKDRQEKRNLFIEKIDKYISAK